MIRDCTAADFEAIYEIINDDRKVEREIVDDCRHM